MVVEVLEIAQPLRMDCDSARTVVGIAGGVGVSASLNDVAPYGMQRVARQSVSRMSFDELFVVNAATGTGSASEKAGCCGSGALSAIALTEPNDIAVRLADWPKRNESFESLACNICGVLAKGDILGHSESPYQTCSCHRAIPVAAVATLLVVASSLYHMRGKTAPPEAGEE